MTAAAFPVVDPWVTGGGRDPLARVVRLHRPVRPGARVYRRRRTVALLLGLTVAVMVCGAARMALARSGGGALAASGSPSGSSSASSASSSSSASASVLGDRTYVVQPGDTLWSIVVAHRHGGDPRPEVDRLSRQVGDRSLQPGERLVLP